MALFNLNTFQRSKLGQLIIDNKFPEFAEFYDTEEKQSDLFEMFQRNYYSDYNSSNESIRHLKDYAVPMMLKSFGYPDAMGTDVESIDFKSRFPDPDIFTHSNCEYNFPVIDQLIKSFINSEVTSDSSKINSISFYNNDYNIISRISMFMHNIFGTYRPSKRLYDYGTNGSSEFGHRMMHVSYVLSSMVLCSHEFSVVEYNDKFTDDERTSKLGQARYYRTQADKDRNRWTYGKVGKALKYLFPHIPVSIITALAESIKEEYPDKVETLYVHESYERKAFSYAYGMPFAKDKNPNADGRNKLLSKSCMRSPVRRDDFGPNFDTIDEAVEADPYNWYTKKDSLYNQGFHPAELYASGDFSIAYVTNSADPFDPDAKVHARSNVMHMGDMVNRDTIKDLEGFVEIRDDYAAVVNIYTTSDMATYMMSMYLKDKYKTAKGDIPWVSTRDPFNSFLWNYATDSYLDSLNGRSKNFFKSLRSKLFHRSVRFLAVLYTKNPEQMTGKDFKKKYNKRNNFYSLYWDNHRERYWLYSDYSIYTLTSGDGRFTFKNKKAINSIEDDALMYFEYTDDNYKSANDRIMISLGQYSGYDSLSGIMFPDTKCFVSGKMHMRGEMSEYQIFGSRRKIFIHMNESLPSNYKAVGKVLYDVSTYEKITVINPNGKRTGVIVKIGQADKKFIRVPQSNKYWYPKKLSRKVKIGDRTIDLGNYCDLDSLYINPNGTIG